MVEGSFPAPEKPRGRSLAKECSTEQERGLSFGLVLVSAQRMDGTNFPLEAMAMFLSKRQHGMQDNDALYAADSLAAPKVDAVLSNR
mmetsp:Transcript_26807/g.55149  ORF Transcript_26807/g.55149 Transcript_26807/m.55149 type:complete len:87 (-) Transcript_26807:1477-1737(-)